MSFETQKQDLHAKWGARFTQPFVFWNNDAETEELDIEAFTPTLVIEDVGTLTLGEGLTRNGSNGLIMKLTGEQSKKKRSAHYYLEFKEGSEAPEYPVNGTIYFDTP